MQWHSATHVPPPAPTDDERERMRQRLSEEVQTHGALSRAMVTSLVWDNFDGIEEAHADAPTCLFPRGANDVEAGSSKTPAARLLCAERPTTVVHAAPLPHHGEIVIALGAGPRCTLLKQPAGVV
jgi:hypothetical protein